MKDFTRVGRIEPQVLGNAAATQKTNNNSVLVSMVTAIHRQINPTQQRPHAQQTCASIENSISVELQMKTNKLSTCMKW
jgi:hypothetical protein